MFIKLMWRTVMFVTRQNMNCVNWSDAEGGIKLSPGDAPGKLFKKVLWIKHSSIPIGWILRLERRGCWFESGLLYNGLSCSKAWRRTFAMFLEEFDSLTVHKRVARLTVQDITLSMWWYGFESRTAYERVVGVMANIRDCLSFAMSSTLIRTANCWVVQWQHIRFWLWWYWFESNPNNKMLALAYQVKHHTVNVENRVQDPESTDTVWCNGNIITSLLFYEENSRWELQVTCLPPGRNSWNRTQMAYSSMEENTSLRMKRWEFESF